MRTYAMYARGAQNQSGAESTGQPSAHALASAYLSERVRIAFNAHRVLVSQKFACSSSPGSALRTVLCSLFLEIRAVASDAVNSQQEVLARDAACPFRLARLVPVSLRALGLALPPLASAASDPFFLCSDQRCNSDEHLPLIQPPPQWERTTI